MHNKTAPQLAPEQNCAPSSQTDKPAPQLLYSIPPNAHGVPNMSSSATAAPTATSSSFDGYGLILTFITLVVYVSCVCSAAHYFVSYSPSRRLPAVVAALAEVEAVFQICLEAGVLDTAMSAKVHAELLR